MTDRQDLMEDLAAYAHEAWSGWVRHLFHRSSALGDGTMVIPAHLVQRWARQMMTSYADLHEAEKHSDRLEAAKIFQVFVKHLNVRLDEMAKGVVDFPPEVWDAIRKSMVKRGMLLPTTEEEVEAAEAVMEQEPPVELPPSLREPPCLPDGCTWGPPRYLIKRGGCFTPYVVIGFRVRCKNCGKVVKDIFLYGYDKIGKEGTDKDFYKEGYYVEADDNRLEEIRRVGPSREECTK